MVLAYFSTVNSTKNKPKSEQKIKLAGGDFPYFTNIADGFMNSKGSECRGKLLEVCLGKCLLEFLEIYGCTYYEWLNKEYCHKKRCRENLITMVR